MSKALTPADSPMLSREESAAYCRVSLRTFDVHVRPALTPKRIGRRVLFAESELQLFLDGCARIQTTGAMERTAVTLVALELMGQDKRRLYFIRRPRDGAVKIGISANVRGRLSTLRGATGEELQLVCDVPGGRLLEEALHRRFIAYQIKGEWFRDSSGLRELADSFVALGPVLRALRERNLFQCALQVVSK